MKIGTNKIVTYEVDEKRAKKFYNRVMSEKKPEITLQQLNELKQTYLFTDIRFNYYGNGFMDATIDGKVVRLILE